MTTGGQLATVLRERGSEILATWIARFERSPLRFRRATKASDHTAQVASLVEALGVAAGGGASALQPGSDATRELEQAAAFIGARFASEGATGFDIAALLIELRDAIAPQVSADDVRAISTLFEWLTVIAQDAFAASGLQSLRERVAEQLEVGTPVVEVIPKVPAVLLVGAPNTSTLDNLLARAWMLAVGSGAPCLVIDCGGLASSSQDQVFDTAYRAFLRQAEGSALQILLASARRPLRERAAQMTAEHNLSFQHFERLDSAVGHAMERAGYHFVKRS